jgi:hypothetical protein
MKIVEQTETEIYIEIKMDDFPLIVHTSGKKLYVKLIDSKKNDFFGMRAEIKSDGLYYFEDGTVIDPNQYVE